MVNVTMQLMHPIFTGPSRRHVVPSLGSEIDSVEGRRTWLMGSEQVALEIDDTQTDTA